MSGPYDDIINLPHPTSERHPRMPMAARAAQFSPFAALTGYEDAVHETARLTSSRAELTEEEKSILDAKLQLLEPGVAASFTYFQPDSRKQGGAYLTAAGMVKRMDSCAREVILANGQKIFVDDIIGIQLEAPGD